MSYLASELVGWGLLGLFNLFYFGTAMYVIHDMFYGTVDNNKEDDLI